MNGWPPLAGTEKQVAWAEDIRSRQVAAMHARLAQKTQQAAGKPWELAVIALANKIIEASAILIRDTDIAEWWIDSRDMPLENLIAADPRFVLGIESANIPNW